MLPALKQVWFGGMAAVYVDRDWRGNN